MTEHELREKIKNILSDNMRWQPYYSIMRGIVYEQDLDNLADALIEKGMIFVDERTIILSNRMSGKTLIHKAQYYDQMKQKVKSYKKALKSLARQYCLLRGYKTKQVNFDVDGETIQIFLNEEDEKQQEDKK